MEKMTYSIENVIGRLSAKIANLEVQLAHEQSAKEAYVKKVHELQQELGDVDIVEKEKSTNAE